MRIWGVFVGFVGGAKCKKFRGRGKKRKGQKKKFPEKRRAQPTRGRNKHAEWGKARAQKTTIPEKTVSGLDESYYTEKCTDNHQLKYTAGKKKSLVWVVGRGKKIGGWGRKSEKVISSFWEGPVAKGGEQTTRS